eukprot:2900321-Prymnesium_polylepis.1
MECEGALAAPSPAEGGGAPSDLPPGWVRVNRVVSGSGRKYSRYVGPGRAGAGVESRAEAWR